MKKITVPNRYNYIGAFLTFNCNLRCHYCINNYDKLLLRTEMTPEEWIRAFSRIEKRDDLAISLQGGEPTLYKGFYDIVSDTAGVFDLLTNGNFNVDNFMKKVNPEVFSRESPYANIRFSYHKGINDVCLYNKLAILKKNKYSVGVWGFDCNDNDDMRDFCRDIGVDFRDKEFLDRNNGTYKYPDAMNFKPREVECKPSELLIAPDGRLYRCHSDLYAGLNSYAHILDTSVIIPTEFSICQRYGMCNPCDIKLKFNRFQKPGHCSVEIKE